MGMIDLAGGDEAAAGLLSAGPYEVIPIYDGDIEYGTQTTAEYFRDESSRYLEDEGFYDKIGYGYSNLGTAPSTSLVSSVGTGPADITVSPTSTTNPDRPRTVAAGYDRSRKVLTVVFRDGTFYNYYSVSGLEWGNFKRARSKGRFIRLYLNNKTRGTASMGSVPEAHQELLYKVARTMQTLHGGYQKGQKIGSKRGGRGMYGSKNTAARSARKSRSAVEKAMGRYT
jgi:hypothetical protein